MRSRAAVAGAAAAVAARHGVSGAAGGGLGLRAAGVPLRKPVRAVSAVVQHGRVRFVLQVDVARDEHHARSRVFCK